MIFTEEQLYQVIRDAKASGWEPTPADEGPELEGASVLLLIDMEWKIVELADEPRLLAHHRATKRWVEVLIAPWLIDKILRREIAKVPATPPEDTESINEEMFRLMLSGHCTVHQVVWSSPEARQEWRLKRGNP